MYEQRSTQENQILDLLTERRGAGVYSYELAEPHPRGCGILQYNARIYGLRKKGYNIVSDIRGHYVLENKQTYMTQTELNEKLVALRIEWRMAGPGLKKLIETRAKFLKKQFSEESSPKASDAWEKITEDNEKV
jgi:hypothetical protein